MSETTRCIASNPLDCEWASRGWCPRCEPCPPAPERAAPTPKCTVCGHTAPPRPFQCATMSDGVRCWRTREHSGECTFAGSPSERGAADCRSCTPEERRSGDCVCTAREYEAYLAGRRSKQGGAAETERLDELLSAARAETFGNLLASRDAELAALRSERSTLATQVEELTRDATRWRTMRSTLEIVCAEPNRAYYVTSNHFLDDAPKPFTPDGFADALGGHGNG